MAKNKKGKTGGKHKGGSNAGGRPRQQKPAWKPNFASASGAYSPPDDLEQSTFTLRDAARSSAHPASYFSNSTLSLRHKTMNFIRGEELVQDDLAKIPRHLTDSPSHPLGLDGAQDEDGTEDEDISMPLAQPPPPELHFEQPQVDSSNSPHKPLSPSDSDDEVVFVGRNHLKELPKSNCPPARHPPPGETNFKPDSVTLHVSSTDDVWEDVTDDPAPPTKHSLIQRLRQPPRLGPKPKGRRSTNIKPSADSDDSMLQDLLDDYVENMRANGELPTEPDQETPAPPFNTNGWGSDEIQDFDDMSTSDEVFENIQMILSKRQRPSGIQYLVVWAGQSVDEARWIPVSLLTMPGADAIIDSFEKEEKLVAEYPNHDSDSDESDDELPLKWTSDSDDSDLEEELDNLLDEEDLIERRIARMTDEHIARLLQKQESLGIFSDQLEIFDGADLVDELQDRTRTSSNKKRNQKRRKQQKQTVFDAEEALMLGGDDYGDFDIMDFERPSLNNNKRAPPDALEALSDSDMADTLREAWATDRKKKRAKKLEREELRAQGLLGKKNKTKPDLKARYTQGMTIEQLFEEIEDFLLNGQQEELSLPPMAKHERKAIHEVARPFGLKSKSQGSNKQRFTILYKTSRTHQLDLDDSDFARLKRQLNRRFLPRMDAKSKGGAFGNAKGRPGEASYRDGEIVGAGAAEIGADNRGRAMLEKMGWSSGTALGALNNQGILKPIEHVVKNSKAGLG